jgi:Gluconate 2-dehydrogenase subunit 3
VPHFFSDSEIEVLTAAAEVVVPGDPERGAPSAAVVGVADYIDTLLGAFSFDPPRIWAGGPFSGRHGGEARFDEFVPLTPIEELAWRTRIEGSRGLPEREFNGPVPGLQERYREGLAALGADFLSLEPTGRSARLDAVPELRSLLYEHACEARYGDPAYSGNRDRVGWTWVGFVGDVQPRGYTDEEVSGRD